ncbi:hypothetical protein AKJ16_DCAP16364 [Drosera capensis]
MTKPNPASRESGSTCHLLHLSPDISLDPLDQAKGFFLFLSQSPHIRNRLMSTAEEKSMPSSQDEEAVIKKKYGGIVPKKPPLISKDHERAYFDSADWALGKQGAEKPKGPLEALRPKLQPTQQQTRYRKSPYAPADGEDTGSAAPEESGANE